MKPTIKTLKILLIVFCVGMITGAVFLFTITISGLYKRVGILEAAVLNHQDRVGSIEHHLNGE